MKVKIKKMSPDAVIPTKAHPSDAGFDFYAASESFDEDGNYVYGTGVALEIPEGYVGLVFPRSSICKKDIILTNSVGVIDSHYRGEVLFKFKSTIRELLPLSLLWTRFSKHGKNLRISNFGSIYKVGDRIGQIIIVPYPEIELEEADELSVTDRGAGGYGSSGN